MSNSAILLFYVGLAALVHLPLMRMSGYRSLVGFKDIRRARWQGSVEQRFVHTISLAGRDRPSRAYDTLTFRTNLGARLVTPAIGALLVFQIVILGFVGIVDVLSFLIIVGMVIWLCFYGWVFKAQVHENEIAWVDFTLRERAHDLAQLVKVDMDQAGCYRLEFEDGQTAYMHSYVEGRGVLKDILITALEINGR